MRALIDGDILRYEIGFAAETGWKAITETEDLPPWRYVRELLDARLAYIMDQTKATEAQLFITEGKTFRDNIAVTKPYKGNRVDKKPYHFKNLTVVMRDVEGAEVVTKIEADDAMALAALADPDNTVIVSRDKDLRQVPVNVFSWELGNQPSFGPERVSVEGSLEYEPERRKLTGTGFAFFCAQMLMGDSVDNIPGVPKVGPKKAYEVLSLVDHDPVLCEQAVEEVYREKCGDEWESYMLEQGRLLWITRKLHKDGTPVLWERGMYE